MTERSLSHATFAIERRYDASPARVFAAWAQPEVKKRWFACHANWTLASHALDFRVGGRETLRTGSPDGVMHAFDALYQDIVADQRIVYTYDMHLDAARISVSLTTVEFKPEGDGTRLVFTEQDVFLDGHDKVQDRELGTGSLLDSLGTELLR